MALLILSLSSHRTDLESRLCIDQEHLGQKGRQHADKGHNFLEPIEKRRQRQQLVELSILPKLHQAWLEKMIKLFDFIEFPLAFFG